MSYQVFLKNQSKILVSSLVLVVFFKSGFSDRFLTCFFCEMVPQLLISWWFHGDPERGVYEKHTMEYYIPSGYLT
jgi:hypothetical protein